jgi:hypothetical protein
MIQTEDSFGVQLTAPNKLIAYRSITKDLCACKKQSKPQAVLGGRIFQPFFSGRIMPEDLAAENSRRLQLLLREAKRFISLFFIVLNACTFSYCITVARVRATSARIAGGSTR